MPRKYETRRRHRTFGRPQTGNVTKIYSINKDSTAENNRKLASILRRVANDLENGDFDRVERLAVVMDQGIDRHCVEFVGLEGNTRDDRWWAGLFQEASLARLGAFSDTVDTEG